MKRKENVKPKVDERFYDKEKHDHLILASHEFKVGDIVLNKIGETYIVKRIKNNYIYAKFPDTLIHSKFFMHAYDSKRWVLRPKEQQKETNPHDNKIFKFLYNVTFYFIALFIMGIAQDFLNMNKFLLALFFGYLSIKSLQFALRMDGIMK